MGAPPLSFRSFEQSEFEQRRALSGKLFLFLLLLLFAVVVVAIVDHFNGRELMMIIGLVSSCF